MARPKKPDQPETVEAAPPPALPKPRRKTGPKPWRATKAELEKITTLSRIGRPIVEIAEVIGISKNTMKGDPAVLRVMRFGGIEANAAVGGKLYEQAMAGNMTAIIFWMKARCGWTEKTTVEHTGKDGAPIKIDTGAFKEMLRGKSPKEVAEIERTIQLLVQFGGIGGPAGPDADARRDNGVSAGD